MNDDIYDDYEAMSKAAAAHLQQQCSANPTALICIATGSSPKRMYQLLAESVKKGDFDPSQLRFVALDEWFGIDRLHPSTCAAFIQENIVEPWGIKPEQLQTFHADASDAHAECRRIQDYLIEHGPIDICILGLGNNGHLGLNEPASALTSYVHVSHLEESSQNHQMLADEGAEVIHGMTIGMADIIASKEIMMFICGGGKTDVYEYLLTGQISTEIPASFLHIHPNVKNFIDKQITG
jgi:galactosamine-6-phosphate isomerase